jgi:formylglycine-generating enzyme required for sulfatase activity
MKKIWLILFLSALLTATAPVNATEDSATDIPKTIYEVEGVSFAMRLAPAGTFPTNRTFLGITEVDDPFLISETEVTYELWETVKTWAIDNGYTFANPGRQGANFTKDLSPVGTPQHPVTTINWRDAIVWLNALSEMTGLPPAYRNNGEIVKDSTNEALCDKVSKPSASDKGFRLPTRNEWELAARYIGGDIFDWAPENLASGTYRRNSPAIAIQEVAWYSANSDSSTHPVGEKKPNTLGLYDMSGNIWEWCFDNCTKSSRWICGGSWAETTIWQRVGAINGLASSEANLGVGFRPVRTQ